MSLGGLLLTLLALAGWASEAASMLRPAPDSAWTIVPLFTVGERLGAYQPPGVLDGIVPLPGAPGRVDLYVTHELESGAGYPFALENGTELLGSRVTRFEMDTARRRIVGGAQAIRGLVDRAGRPVTAASQVNERGRAGGRRGLDSLCSAAGVAAGQFNFVDSVVFLNEESTAAQDHAHGGSIWALEPSTGIAWALPALGRGSWENVTALQAPGGQVALLLGDDYEFGRAPLYLWVGRTLPGGSFPERNGLVHGQLHVWVADNGDRSPRDWYGSGTGRSGRFLPIGTRDPHRAGHRGHDARGYLDDTTLRARARQLGAFMFSRPEDLHTNPARGDQAAFASTGSGLAFPRDDWGGIHVVQVSFPAVGPPRGHIALIYDSDDTADRGIRSPDNLVWARDGRIYVQEDKATKLATFGAESGREASIWSLDPARPAMPELVATVDRSAVPPGANDRKARTVGEWESSGIADLTGLLPGPADEVVLVADVQAHGVTDGPIGGRERLVEAGQLLLLTRYGPATSRP